MGLDLRDLRKPLEDVTFPNGVKHQPIPFGANEYQLWRDMQKETDAHAVGRLGLAIIRACYPTVTDEDLLDCDADMLLALAAYPGGKIEQVRAALKNVGAAPVVEAAPATTEPPPATARSSPKTNGATSSRVTRKRSAKTGGVSTATSAPNSSGSLSTISTTPNASTRFAESSTTLTAPA